MADDFKVTFTADLTAVDSAGNKCVSVTGKIVGAFNKAADAAKRLHMAMEVVNHFTFLVSGFKAAVDLYKDLQEYLNKAGLEAYKLASAQAKLAQDNSIAKLASSYRELAEATKAAALAEQSRRKVQDIGTQGRRALEDANLANAEQIALDGAKTDAERERVRIDFARRRNNLVAARQNEDAAANVSRLGADSSALAAQIEERQRLLDRHNASLKMAQRNEAQARSTAFEQRAVGLLGHNREYIEQNESVRKAAAERIPELEKITKAERDKYEAAQLELRQLVARKAALDNEAEAYRKLENTASKLADAQNMALDRQLRAVDQAEEDARHKVQNESELREYEYIRSQEESQQQGELRKALTAWETVFQRGVSALPSLQPAAVDSYAQRGIIVGGRADSTGVNENILKVLTDFYRTMKARDPSPEGEAFARLTGSNALAVGVQ